MTMENLTTEEKIRAAMKRKGYTYKKLADEMGISISYVYELVKGNSGNIKRINDMRKILGI